MLEDLLQYKAKNFETINYKHLHHSDDYKLLIKLISSLCADSYF